MERRCGFHLGKQSLGKPRRLAEEAGERGCFRPVRSLELFSQRSRVSDLKETEERKVRAQAGRAGRKGVEREDKERRGCQACEGWQGGKQRNKTGGWERKSDLTVWVKICANKELRRKGRQGADQDERLRKPRSIVKNRLTDLMRGRNSICCQPHKKRLQPSKPD